MKIKDLDLLDKRQDAALRRRGFKTYTTWITLGRCVAKGQRASEWFSDGSAAFRRGQTTELILCSGDDDYDEYC